jgi:excisionase family DNA binding protein
VYEGKYYSIPEVAKMMRVPTDTVWDWLEKGKLQAHRKTYYNLVVHSGDLHEFFMRGGAKGK